MTVGVAAGGAPYALPQAVSFYDCASCKVKTCLSYAYPIASLPPLERAHLNYHLDLEPAWQSEVTELPALGPPRSEVTSSCQASLQGSLPKHGQRDSGCWNSCSHKTGFQENLPLGFSKSCTVD